MCGYVVELVRSSYYSNWRLYRGRPDILTPGRYVFAKPGTPAYPGKHWFGSRNWTTNDFKVDPPMGEERGTKRKYYRGDRPALMPPPGLIGTRRCISGGETPGNVTPGLTQGFDSRCYLLRPAPPVPGAVYIDINQREVQQAGAQMIAELYAGSSNATAIMNAMLGPGAVVTTAFNPVGIQPGYVIGVQGTTTVVAISGTVNYQQWALQGAGGLRGPLQMGFWSSVPLWYQGAQHLQAAIQAAGGDPNGQIVLIGHSYGGAVAVNLAAMYLNQNPARPVQILTFGSPVPGDVRLAQIVRPAIQVHIVNAGDIVAAMPPTGPLLTAVTWVTPPVVRQGWDQWIPLTGVVGLAADGTMTANPTTNDLLGIALTVVRDLILGNPPASVTAHSMEEYIKRMGGTVPPGVTVVSGSIFLWPAATTPAGYLWCNGATVSRTTYAALFAVMGTTWGPGDGVNTFTLPDFRGRAPVGDGPGPGLTDRAVGVVGGEEQHILGVGELPAHNHELPPGKNFVDDLVGGAEYATAGANKGSIEAKTLNAGGGGAHNNMQPFVVARWVVKV